MDKSAAKLLSGGFCLLGFIFGYLAVKRKSQSSEAERMFNLVREAKALPADSEVHRKYLLDLTTKAGSKLEPPMVLLEGVLKATSYDKAVIRFESDISVYNRFHLR